jgi:hypothetical protein
MRTATEAFLTGCKAHVDGFVHVTPTGTRKPDEFLVVGPARRTGFMQVQDVIDGDIAVVPTSMVTPIVTWPTPTAEQVGWDVVADLLPPHG